MFEDEHLLEGGRCGSASHCETLSIAVASLSHQIILSQPPIAFTCSISLFAVFLLRTSPPGCGHAGQKIASSPAPTSFTLFGPPAYPAHFNFFIQRQTRAILRNSRYKSSTSPGAIGIVSRRINW